MSAITERTPNAMAAEALGFFANGVDPRRVDDFLDVLLDLAELAGASSCTLVQENCLRVLSRDVILTEVEIPSAKTKLRLACARLAVRCGEWANRTLSPYGAAVEVTIPGTNQAYRIQFENSTAAQLISIESR